MELSLPSEVGEKGPHRSPAQLPQGIALSHSGAARPALEETEAFSFTVYYLA